MTGRPLTDEERDALTSVVYHVRNRTEIPRTAAHTLASTVARLAAKVRNVQDGSAVEITVIERGSQAFNELAAYFANPDTYKVSIDVRRPDGIAVKCNEGMWTTTLRITVPPKGANE